MSAPAFLFFWLVLSVAGLVMIWACTRALARVADFFDGLERLNGRDPLDDEGSRRVYGPAEVGEGTAAEGKSGRRASGLW